MGARVQGAETEYRAEYCWFVPDAVPSDPYTALVRAKIAGTLDGTGNEAPLKFGFEQGRSGIKPVVIGSYTKAPGDSGVGGGGRVSMSGGRKKRWSEIRLEQMAKQRAAKGRTRLVKHHFRSGAGRTKFANYGEGNRSPILPEHYGFTFNVHAPHDSVYPDTLRRAEWRKQALETYRTPEARAQGGDGSVDEAEGGAGDASPVAASSGGVPLFFPSVSSIPPSRRADAAGPFYLECDGPVPAEYAPIAELSRK